MDNLAKQEWNFVTAYASLSNDSTVFVFNKEIIPSTLRFVRDMHWRTILWQKLDADHNNEISSKEWGRAVVKYQHEMSVIFGGSTAEEIGKLFLLVDENHDDTISWDEFIVASHAGKLLNIWKKLDENHDGRVDSHEWGHAVGILWEEMSSIFGGKSKREVGEIFNSIDVNNDLTISWDEILNAFYLVTYMRWSTSSFCVKSCRIQIHSIRKAPKTL